jgi:hypothetical protein
MDGNGTFEILIGYSESRFPGVSYFGAFEVPGSSVEPHSVTWPTYQFDNHSDRVFQAGTGEEEPVPSRRLQWRRPFDGQRDRCSLPAQSQFPGGHAPTLYGGL